MRDLSAQQQEIVDAMAKSEQLLTPSEIAAAALLSVTVVNSQIKRLERDGYVKRATKHTGRGVRYDLRERLFGLWRQMRVEAGRQRLRFIVRFLELWYSAEENEETILRIKTPSKDMLRLLKDLVSTGRLDLLKEALVKIDSAKDPELVSLFKPFRIFLAYIESGDQKIIDKLRPEERDIFEEMLELFKSAKDTTDARPPHEGIR